MPRLGRPVTIAVVAPRSGVGTTTITALFGTLMATLRSDRVIAADFAQHPTSLVSLLAPNHHVDGDPRPPLARPNLSVVELQNLLVGGPGGLLILPEAAPTEESSCRLLIDRLRQLAGLLLLDCGSDLHKPVCRAAVGSADQILLVTDADPLKVDLATEAAMAMSWEPRPLTVVLNKMPRRGANHHLDDVGIHLTSTTEVVEIPNHRAASRIAGGGFDWPHAPEEWQAAYRLLAVKLVSQWPGMGLTRRE